MRTEREMFELILSFAQRDARVRAAVLCGSRANPSAPRDRYQDYDIVYLVDDFDSFTADHGWIDVFGPRLMLQMPEAMRYPSGESLFSWMMLLADGNRIDLTLIPTSKRALLGSDSLNVALLDKDGILPPFAAPSDRDYLVRPPSALFFLSCCNNFWWCLQNVAKGIARGELPYAMMMLHTVVRPELHDMLSWYIGAKTDFSVSTGKMGKYFQNHLPDALYRQYCATYTEATPDALWAGVFAMCDLFHTAALAVSAHLGISYRQHEEDGMRTHLSRVKGGRYR